MTVFVQPGDRPEEQKEQVAVIPTGVRAEQHDGRLRVYDAQDHIVGDFGSVVWWFAGEISPSEQLDPAPGLASTRNGIKKEFLSGQS
jgi:hypothetical protein